jgi:hypothetical protein
VDHARAPIEDELVLAPDEVAVRQVHSVVARAVAEHLLAFAALPRVEGRGGYVEDDGGACLGGLCHELGDPHVLADRHSEDLADDLEQQRLRARLEVALFVKHAVVGKAPLPVDCDLAVRAHGRSVVQDPAVGLHEAHHRGDPHAGGRNSRERLADVVDEVALADEVLGRIAGERQLGDQENVGLAGDGRLHGIDDESGVAGDVAHRAVDLRERDAGHLRVIS